MRFLGDCCREVMMCYSACKQSVRRSVVCRVVLGFSLLCVVVCGRPALGYADDWFEVDYPFVVANPLRLTKDQWARFSLQAGDYRTVLDHAGSDHMFRSTALVSSAVLTVPHWPVQPYLGAGFGLGVMNLTPEDIMHSPLLEESLVWQIGGAIAYHVQERFSLISSVHYVQFQASDVLRSSHLESLVPLISSSGLDAEMYTVTLGLRFQF